MKDLRVGVIGVGNIGQHHVRVLSALRGVELSGVADTNEDQAGAIAHRYGSKPFREFRELFSEVDAVIIAVPTSLHYEVGMACIDAGLHVLIEKPLAETCVQAEELTEAASRREVVLQVGHVERFSPAFQELKKVLNGDVPFAIEARRLSPFSKRANDVSVVFDLMVHDLDLILDVVQSTPIRISATGRAVKSEFLNHVMAQITFQNGVIANLIASKVTQSKIREFNLTCEEAYICVDFLANALEIYRHTSVEYLANHDNVLYKQDGIVEKVHVPSIEPLYAEVAHFMSTVQDGNQPVVGGLEGTRVLKLATQIEGLVYDGGQEYVERQVTQRPDGHLYQNL